MRISKLNIVYNQLLKLGFKKSRRGTLYIAEAVVFLSHKEYKYPLYLTKEGVYTYLSEKYNTNVSTVKAHLLLACRLASKKLKRKVKVKGIILFLLKYNSKDKL